MKGIKVLQAATLGTFILFVIIGIVVLFAFPEKMTAYRDFIGAIWPIFVAEVVPAFLGTPLKEYVKNKGSKMNTLDMFRTCRNKDGYKKTWLGADWKIVGDIMYFQQSRGKLDWTFNILSAFRIPGRLGKTWFLFPFGAWCMWKTLKKVIKKNPVKAYVGYSQGGWFASYASATTTRPAYTFGCPKLGKGQAYLFGDVIHRKNPGDVVTMVPPWAETYGQVMILNKQIERPDVLTDLEWLSHHTPYEYIERLT